MSGNSTARSASMVSQLCHRDKPARLILAALVLGVGLFSGCQTATAPGSSPQAKRQDDVVIVAGQRYHTGTRVITWQEPGGYNAYQKESTLAPRQDAGNPRLMEKVKKNGWDLPALQGVVDQFVLHYDGAGLSKICFNVLQQRKLNVHFLLDVDGTIYQTLDLQERALHATIANSRSIGIEIANLGAFPRGETKLLEEWYQRDSAGQVSLRVPTRINDPGISTKNFVARPARQSLIRGRVQTGELVQYDFTPEQYIALTRLTATLCRLFPKIKCDFPRDSAGRLVTKKLPDAELAKYQGIIGHFHIQENKHDPGPAFQWHRLVEGARLQMR